MKPDYDPFPAYRRRIALDHVRRGNQFWEKHQFDHAIGAYSEAFGSDAWREQLALWVTSSVLPVMKATGKPRVNASS